jgi:ubiquinone/menaquinone biosynthesis C-methylase UbiE
VGFYSHVIFPRLCDFLLRQPAIACHRRVLLRHATGEVLEIGFGTGLNLPHYPGGVRKLTTVDPNPAMQRLARSRIKKAAIAVDARLGSSEHLPFADGVFDTLVSTFTLCSVADVVRTLAEARRVLKPGGKFLFLEHGLSPEPGVQSWQRRLNWLEIRLGDGCHLDRDIRTLVAAQFSSLEVVQFYVEGTPRTHGFLSRGVARK